MTTTDQAERPEVVSVAVAARRAGISERQYYRLAQRGMVPAFRIGQRWVVPTYQLDRLLTQQDWAC